MRTPGDYFNGEPYVEEAKATCRTDWRECPNCHLEWPHPSETSGLYCPSCRVAKVEHNFKLLSEECDVWMKDCGELRKKLAKVEAERDALIAALVRLVREMDYIKQAPTYELRWTAESEAAKKQAEVAKVEAARDSGAMKFQITSAVLTATRAERDALRKLLKNATCPFEWPHRDSWRIQALLESCGEDTRSRLAVFLNAHYQWFEDTQAELAKEKHG